MFNSLGIVLSQILQIFLKNFEFFEFGPIFPIYHAYPDYLWPPINFNFRKKKPWSSLCWIKQKKLLTNCTSSYLLWNLPISASPSSQISWFHAQCTWLTTQIITFPSGFSQIPQTSLPGRSMALSLQGPLRHAFWRCQRNRSHPQTWI